MHQCNTLKRMQQEFQPKLLKDISKNVVELEITRLQSKVWNNLLSLQNWFKSTF